MARLHKSIASLADPDFKHDPARARVEYKPNGPIGSPPDHWGAAKKAIWMELTGEVAPAGVLCRADRYVVELTVELMAKMRDPDHGMGAHGGLPVSAVSILLQCLARLGLTPVDRARINVAAESA